MKDRAMQALYLMALAPVAETTADANSYGFRKERSTADAVQQCFNDLARTTSPQWILEGDIKGCFDHISHEWLLDNIPMDKVLLRKWLKSGFIFNKQTFFRQRRELLKAASSPPNSCKYDFGRTGKTACR